MARIVIAGCGDVGTALGLRLAAVGHEVWGLKRHPATLPAALRPLAADLADPASLAGLPERLDAVVYAAAAGGYRPERYRVAYVDGVANLLAALAAQGQRLQRLLLVSSTSVYGQSGGEWIDEESPAVAAGFAADSLRAGEQLVWAGSQPATVIRFGGIYGPGRTRLIDQVRRGEAVCEEGLFTNRIHRDDCASALVHLLALPAPAPLYLGVDDEPALQCEVMRWLARQLGVAGPTVSSGSDPVRPRSNKRCRNARLRDSGWRPAYPGYREGYRPLLDTGAAPPASA